MKILLTGATGFIGTNFVLNLHDKYEIVALVREGSNTSKIESFCKVYRYDGKIESLIKIFKEEKFDGVVHLATLYKANHTYNEIDSLIYSNIKFGVDILEAIKVIPVAFFINTMTAFEYSNSDKYNPVNFYAATKHAFFDIIKYYSGVASTYFSHLMIFDTYGANDTRPKIFNLWKKIAKSGEVLEMSAGEQKIDISHVDDVINGFDILIDLCVKKKVKNNQIFALESPKRYFLRKLAKIFEKGTNIKLNIKWGAKPYRENEIMNPVSTKRCKEIKKLPKWKQKINLEKGIEALWKNEKI